MIVILKLRPARNWNELQLRESAVGLFTIFGLV